MDFSSSIPALFDFCTMQTGDTWQKRKVINFLGDISVSLSVDLFGRRTHSELDVWISCFTGGRNQDESALNYSCHKSLASRSVEGSSDKRKLRKKGDK